MNLLKIVLVKLVLLIVTNEVMATELNSSNCCCQKIHGVCPAFSQPRVRHFLIPAVLADLQGEAYITCSSTGIESAQSITKGQPVRFNTVVQQDAKNTISYDSTTHVFTTKEAGVYLITFAAHSKIFEDLPDAIALKVNGAVTTDLKVTHIDDGIMKGCCMILPANSTFEVINNAQNDVTVMKLEDTLVHPNHSISAFISIRLLG
jgi:hypothetical protein